MRLVHNDADHNTRVMVWKAFPHRYIVQLSVELQHTTYTHTRWFFSERKAFVFSEVGWLDFF